MKLIHGGIHKRIGFIIQHTGGYDRQYHITAVSKKLNIDRKIISDLFKFSRRSNLLHYIGLLESGMEVERVIRMANYDNKITMKRINSTYSMLNRLCQHSVVGIR